MPIAPKIYVRVLVDGNGKNQYVVGENLTDLGIGIDEKAKVGVYQSVSVLEVTGVLQSTEIADV